VITVCDRAREECPVFSGEPERLHWPFEDPAAFTETGEERLCAFRKLRDRIHARVMVFLGEGAYGSPERGQIVSGTGLQLAAVNASTERGR
jgi:hypothetical protein